MGTTFLASNAEGHLLQISPILRSIPRNNKYPGNSRIWIYQKCLQCQVLKEYTASFLIKAAKCITQGVNLYIQSLASCLWVSPTAWLIGIFFLFHLWIAKAKVEIIPSAKSVAVSSLTHSRYSLLSILWEILLKTNSSALVDKAINITSLTPLQSTTWYIC